MGLIINGMPPHRGVGGYNDIFIVPFVCLFIQGIITATYGTKSSVGSEVQSLTPRSLRVFLWTKLCPHPHPNSYVEAFPLKVTVFADRASRRHLKQKAFLRVES